MEKLNGKSPPRAVVFNIFCYYIIISLLDIRHTQKKKKKRVAAAVVEGSVASACAQCHTFEIIFSGESFMLYQRNMMISGNMPEKMCFSALRTY